MRRDEGLRKTGRGTGRGLEEDRQAEGLRKTGRGLEEDRHFEVEVRPPTSRSALAVAAARPLALLLPSCSLALSPSCSLALLLSCPLALLRLHHGTLQRALCAPLRAPQSHPAVNLDLRHRSACRPRRRRGSPTGDSPAPSARGGPSSTPPQRSWPTAAARSTLKVRRRARWPLQLTPPAHAPAHALRTSCLCPMPMPMPVPMPMPMPVPTPVPTPVPVSRMSPFPRPSLCPHALAAAEARAARLRPKEDAFQKKQLDVAIAFLRAADVRAKRTSKLPKHAGPRAHASGSSTLDSWGSQEGRLPPLEAPVKAAASVANTGTGRSGVPVAPRPTPRPALTRTGVGRAHRRCLRDLPVLHAVAAAIGRSC